MAMDDPGPARPAPGPATAGTLPGPAHWPTAALQQALAAIQSGFQVSVVPELDSTNSELMRRARAGHGAPCLLVAERQTAGRGRLGRQWLSERDAAGAADPGATPPALTFSLGMALAPASWSGLSLVVGITVAQALHPRLGLKWPNDLWLDGRKMAGILIETASTATQRYTVIGVGINIAPRAPSALVPTPAWLQELTPEADPPGTLAQIAPKLVQAVTRFEAEGFGPFRDAFAQRDVLRGRAVVLSDGGAGVAQGVDESGALLVHTADGMRVVTSAEVSVRPVGAASGAS